MIELASDDGLILHLWQYWIATGTAMAGICIGLTPPLLHDDVQRRRNRKKVTSY